MSNIRAKNSLAAEVMQLIAGANKHFPDGSQALQVGGATFTVTALTQELQGFVDNRDAVEASKAATKAKIEIERVQSPSQLALIRAFQTVIRGTFGNSAEQKAVTAAKIAATRKARGTMGKNQKKSVKGSVTAQLVVTPVTTSPVSTSIEASVAAAPAPATPATTTAAPTVAATAPHSA